MNRRGFLGFLAAAPLAPIAVKAAPISDMTIELQPLPPQIYKRRWKKGVKGFVFPNSQFANGYATLGDKATTVSQPPVSAVVANSFSFVPSLQGETAAAADLFHRQQTAAADKFEACGGVEGHAQQSPRLHDDAINPATAGPCLVRGVGSPSQVGIKPGPQDISSIQKPNRNQQHREQREQIQPIHGEAF